MTTLSQKNPSNQRILSPMVALVMGTSALSCTQTYASSNVASVEWRIIENSPTQCSSVLAVTQAPFAVKSSGLAVSALAKTVLINSRPMEAWEKEDADEFFRSQFA